MFSSFGTTLRQFLLRDARHAASVLVASRYIASLLHLVGIGSFWLVSPGPLAQYPQARFWAGSIWPALACVCAINAMALWFMSVYAVQFGRRSTAFEFCFEAFQRPVVYAISAAFMFFCRLEAGDGAYASALVLALLPLGSVVALEWATVFGNYGLRHVSAAGSRGVLAGGDQVGAFASIEQNASVVSHRPW